MLGEFTVYRKPTRDEQRLIKHLVSEAKDFTLPDDWAEKLAVEDMDDGGMGSLKLVVQGLAEYDREFGRQVSECQFADADDINVIASLYVDQKGNLFELDIWKTNFDKLIKIPACFLPVQVEQSQAK
ncbi:DUF6984 family protein [Microbulbifer rhizosphaerae]|uniref:Transcription antitermination factor NusG n=1 Tax=Microbulbifer rhizosphaerae TaxID=1562603 RepID=A0A7W4WBF6_9GAMM|nr:hypothetical protein [Microbulbifer rhizosphaerae]MBB3060486.1 transcription antitermination factor NusG [Microbulbifer rhizosphaerae]